MAAQQTAPQYTLLLEMELSDYDKVGMMDLPLELLCDACGHTLFILESLQQIQNGATTLLPRFLQNINHTCPNCNARLSTNFDYEIIKIGERKPMEVLVNV